MFDALGWIGYMVSFVSIVFFGVNDIGIYAFLIGAVFHWKFWSVILIGFLVGRSISG